MGGFALDWLDLRETADGAARNPGLLRAAVAWLDRGEGDVLDLGCGTGSTWRAVAPLLGRPRSWRLLDNDPYLLEVAARRTRGEVAIILAELDALDTVSLEGVRMVTASALLDLVSEAWARDLASRIAEARAGFYAALNYDGVVTWFDPHPLDGRVIAAFNAHQGIDKGLGPALGPNAWRVMSQALRDLGYRVETATSPWRLDSASIGLSRALVAGIGDAAAEMGLDIADWLEARSRLGPGVEVGHLDLLALPPEVTVTGAKNPY